MQHYQTAIGALWALSIEQIAAGWETKLPEGSVKISDEQVATILEARRVDAITGDTVRAERDGKLSHCDWTQLPDVPQATREKWAAYRQALRDVPKQDGFPKLVEWPTIPV